MEDFGAVSGSRASTKPASGLGPTGFDPGEGVTISREVYDFLMGAGPLEGVWFGELNEGLPGAFWWRGVLSCAAGWPEPPAIAPTDTRSAKT